VAATRTNAELLRIASEVGTVQEGKQADLILVDGDPLREPEILGDAGRVRLVCLGGRIVKDLEAGRELSRAGRAG
jgi:imidazolonepropionase-like amidohydrolase